MPILPYCIYDPSAQLPEIVTGVMQASTKTLVEGDVAALFSEVSALPTEAGELAQAAMSFQSTVQQAFGAGVVIPFRFPTLLADESALRAHLVERREEYRRALSKLQGLAQMEVRLTKLGGTLRSEAPQSGTEYLKSRQSESKSVADATSAIREAAGDLVREWRQRESGGVTRCYALITHDAAAEFKRRVGFVRLAGGMRAIISGPWPASEFVAEEK